MAAAQQNLLADGCSAFLRMHDLSERWAGACPAVLPAGVVATITFNPMADRLRIIGSDGTNLRANVDDGKITKDGQLKFADSDMHKGRCPRSSPAPTPIRSRVRRRRLSTILTPLGALVKRAPPNDGVLNSVGMLGLAADHAAFDIFADGNGGNAAWLMVGDTLSKVDLVSGKGTQVTKISGVGGAVRDITAIPKM